jgi:hypothetical protein
MENGGEAGQKAAQGISGYELAILAGIGLLGLAVVRWLVHHPEESRRLDMALLLGTQKASLALSDASRRVGDKFRYVADRAGTQYNEIRSV